MSVWKNGLHICLPNFPAGKRSALLLHGALVTQPAVVLADEPSGNLDVARSAELHELIWELARTRHQTCIIVTHDQHLAARADRVVEMADGRLDA